MTIRLGSESIKTQDTTYTDTLVKINDKKENRNTINKTMLLKMPHHHRSPSLNTRQNQAQTTQSQAQQTPPSILKKSNIFTSSYDQLVNEDESSNKTNFSN